MDMRTCLVTGANRGLGLEFTRPLLAAGAHVVATCRQPGKASALNGLAGEHPGRLRVMPRDVANPNSIPELERELPLLDEDRSILLLGDRRGLPAYGEPLGSQQEK